MTGVGRGGRMTWATGYTPQPSGYFTSQNQADWSKPANSSTFKPALELFPSGIREDAIRLYRVMRVLDDLVDERQPQAAERIAALERWCETGTIDSPEAQVFADLAQRRHVTPEPVAEFCKAMRSDLAGTPFDTEAELLLYCRRIGAIGTIGAQMLGTTHPSAEDKMVTLGMAMQLTNILRDIDEDLAHDRNYIPRELIERHGSIAPGKRESLLREQIPKADRLYDEGATAIPLLREGRRGVAAALVLYREILRQIEREGYGQRPGRVIVPAWRRRLVLARSRSPTRPYVPPGG
jgi:15-cis-phytoene synthase